ncbi:STAS domain-containing protein [Pseudenhygromyxa sp. WMMC2535]|uniref:STAS domain-containing protein n=1 Tax=Pseudenhygromyxa sp. WMMC2535 TaxID=2712867 RepID=UPI001595BCAE|nr:STAS domain-containing protein [Pseudenhygromyxa sp. WMMC2535]NVB41238.1 STAS domain-containing protein [Pseudenhygromyxa sp. WMMC2535]
MDHTRLGRVLDVVVAAFSGDYGQRVPLEENEDPLLEVELAINYLLDELALRRDENLAQTRALREQSLQIQTQTEALVAALSTPLLTLWPGVLILPLIGAFDRERAERTTATLLGRISSERARYVILDLTGIDSISSDTASSLLRMTRSARLLGVTCLVTGIHPRTARQLIELGADTTGVRTFSQVSEALEVVLQDTRVRA